MKATGNRKAILAAFMEAGEPLDAAAVLERVADRIDRATVFRILNAFAEAGLLDKLEFNEGKARYELSLKEHHHHTVCTSCGAVACIAECDLERLVGRVHEETGFDIDSHRLEFFGTCARCRGC
jgi:Fur family ferric uptake transcriptional regulator